MKNKAINKPVFFAYVGIAFVVLFWGVVPSFKKMLIGDSFSASVYTAVTALSAALVLLFMNLGSLKKINRSYFKVAIPTGVCLGAATLLQALAYNFDASPTNQAFLENLSCIAVPIILFVAIKKKPTFLTVSACVLCMISSMVLAGVFSAGIDLKTADILNALAGIIYGVNIAVSGMYAKRFSASIYVMIQHFVYATIAAVMAVALNFVTIGGRVVDPFVFTADILPILGLLLLGALSNALCWTVRTHSMKFVSASAVAVIMPLSAVVTGAFAIILGQDEPSASLFIGGAIGFVAAIISGMADINKNEKT